MNIRHPNYRSGGASAVGSPILIVVLVIYTANPVKLSFQKREL